MERIATYDELRAAITRAFPELSRQLQHIARFATEHPNDMALETVATIAGRAAVPPSSLVRFAQALGFDGFSDMQQVFRSRLVERSLSYRERIARLTEETEEGASPTPATLLGRFVDDAVTGLRHMADGIRPDLLDRAVALLAKARTIHLLGQRRAFPVAFYLRYAIGQLDLPAHLLDGAAGLLEQQARLVTPADALVVVSFRNYSEETLEVAAECHARGVPVLAVTDGPLSPLVHHAAVCLEVDDDQTRPFRSLVPPMCLAQALVVSLGQHIEARRRA